MFLLVPVYRGTVITIDPYGNAEIIDHYDYEVVDPEALYIELLVRELEMALNAYYR